MIIIPAIDLKAGQCVRLQQGNMNKADVYGEDAVSVAKHWNEVGARRLHIVDLDGAFAAQPCNHEVIADICQALPNLPIQVGGGIRSMATLAHYFDLGIGWCIMGTKAIESFEFLVEACAQYPGKIMLGIDAKNGMVAVDGWAEVASISALDLAQKCHGLPLDSIVYTDISRDGMLSGVNVAATQKMAQVSECPVIASGGVKNLEDIEALCAVANSGIKGAITGRAIYTGDLDLQAAQQYADARMKQH